MGVFLGAFGKCHNKKTIIHKGLAALYGADNRHHLTVSYSIIQHQNPLSSLEKRVFYCLRRSQGVIMRAERDANPC
jgi:hypothetical protein